MLIMPSANGPGRGGLRADQVRESDRLELSEGRPIHCAPAGDRHGSAHTQGAKVLSVDPAAAGKVGIDVGYTFGDGKYLRAPDVSVGASREHGPGLVRSLLTVLQSRGLAVGDDVRARIEACRDPELLTRWIARAATAEHTIAVFG